MSTPAAHIPDELFDQLHRASEKFHERRVALEKAMEGSEYRHQERVNAAQAGLNQAEHAVEEVEARIHDLLSPDSGRG